MHLPWLEPDPAKEMCRHALHLEPANREIDVMSDIDPATVPEPAPIGMLGAALAALGLLHRRRKRA
jgi:hypothetical protein